MATRIYDPNFTLNNEVANIGWSDPDIESKAKIGKLDNPFRFTNIVFLTGDEGRAIKLKGVWNTPFNSVGIAWTSSSGSNPLPTIQYWERNGTSLNVDLDNGTGANITLTSVNITAFHYKLIEGQPFNQTNIQYEMDLLESIA
jgi:hypothetical protein